MVSTATEDGPEIKAIETGRLTQCTSDAVREETFVTDSWLLMNMFDCGVSLHVRYRQILMA